MTRLVYHHLTGLNFSADRFNTGRDTYRGYIFLHDLDANKVSRWRVTIPRKDHQCAECGEAIPKDVACWGRGYISSLTGYLHGACMKAIIECRYKPSRSPEHEDHL